MDGSIMPIPAVIFVLVTLLSLAVPVIGLYLLWQIKTSVTNIERTLATLLRDRQ